MNPTSEERAAEVFQEVYALAGAARELALASLTGEDVSLRTRVEALLDGHDRNAADVFLERPALGSGVGPPALYDSIGAEEPGPVAPRRAGPFEIRDLLAEGVFASVYLAEQTEPIRRTAAIKVLHAGGRRTLARFALERQAVAAMRHPHIAQFYGAGTTDTGLAYFAMEHVDGPPITEFCRDGGLSTPDRLALFLQVCAAVTHAHQRGIIHRDLKPSNILVAAGDADGLSVKVIDFGVAKALEAPDCGSRATLTGQVVGTLAYMSPEQLAGRIDAIDTRTDVYSLGLMLYEMLVGSPAFPPEACGTPPVALRHPDTPPPRLAGARHDLRGDLDTIVAKATAGAPDARYGSVADLAADVARSVAGLPILARRANRLYTAGKFVRRHRVGTTTAVLALVTTMFMGVAVWRARTERLDLAMRLADAWLNETLRMQRTIGERGLRGPIVERLVEQVDRLAEAAPSDPRVLAMRAAALTERGYLAMDSARPQAALADFGESLRLRQDLASRAPGDSGRRMELSLSLVRAGDAAGALGDATARLALYQEALHLDEALARSAPLDHRALSNLGWSYERVGAIMPEGDAGRLAFFQKQAATFARLAAISPTSESHRGQCAAFINTGLTLDGMDAPFTDAARKAVEQGLAAVAADPNDRLAHHAIIRAELLGARAAGGSGDPEAVSLAEQAAEHAQALFDRDPADWDSRELLAVVLTRAAELAERAGQSERAAGLAARAVPHVEQLSARPGGSRWNAELTATAGLPEPRKSPGPR